MNKGIVAALLFVSCAYAAGVHADTMRCGNRLVTTGDSSGKVLRLCGEPTHRDAVRIEKKKVERTTAEGSVSETVEVAVERWSYDQGHGRLLKILEFRDGVLTTIEDGERM